MGVLDQICPSVAEGCSDGEAAAATIATAVAEDFLRYASFLSAVQMG